MADYQKHCLHVIWSTFIQEHVNTPLENTLRLFEKIEHLTLYPLMLLSRSITQLACTFMTLAYTSYTLAICMAAWVMIYAICQHFIQNKNQIMQFGTIEHKKQLEEYLRDFNHDNLKSRFHAHTQTEWPHLLQLYQKYACSQQNKNNAQNTHQILTHFLCTSILVIVSFYFIYYELSIDHIILCLTCVIFCIDHTQWMTEQSYYLRDTWSEADQIIKEFQRTDKINLSQQHIDNFNQYTAIIGPSGSGKTTLIASYIDQLKKAKIFDHEKVIVITQHDQILHRSVMENLSVGMKTVTTAHALQAMKYAHIDYILHSLVNGINTKISPQMLSSGQQQQLLIARAFAYQPDILICDEGSAAIDMATTDQIIQNLKTQLPHTKIIWVSHRTQELVHFPNKIKLRKNQLQDTKL